MAVRTLEEVQALLSGERAGDGKRNDLSPGTSVFTLLRDLIDSLDSIMQNEINCDMKIDEILAEVTEIEHHIHNYGRAFGAIAVPTATRFAETLGVLAVATENIFFRFTPAAANVWGAWAQVWGTDDAAAILPVGKRNFWDLHKIKLVDANDDKKNYIMQLALDNTSAADALTAGTYLEIPLFIEKGDKAPAPTAILMDKVPAANSAWVRILTTDGNAASTLDVQFEAHGYSE